MNAYGKTLRNLVISTTCLFVGVASYNSYKFNHVGSLKNDFNIKLTKRLDETYGKVKFGRMAASLRKSWKVEKEDKKLIENVNKVVREKFKPLLKKETASKSAPVPAIANDLDLELTGGIYNKKPLKEGTDFSGSAKVVDGVIEEISVALPGGKNFTINTSERMVGNVFQYEDTNTREQRSGLFYEVKKGTYMITLTDDSQFSGIRLQFTAPENSQIETGSQEDVSWAMNNQNDNADDAYQANNEKDDFGYQYEGNEYKYEEDTYEKEKYEDTKKAVSPYSHSFGV